MLILSRPTLGLGFPILSLSKNSPQFRRNFSYKYTMIISQDIFNHTPGLKGHAYNITRALIVQSHDDRGVGALLVNDI